MTLMELRKVKAELEELMEELRNTHKPQHRLVLLEKFKKLALLMKQGT